MKLIDLLKVLSDDWCKIYESYDGEIKDDEEPIFEGWISEIPWSMTERDLIKKNIIFDPVHIANLVTPQGTKMIGYIIIIEEEEL